MRCSKRLAVAGVVVDPLPERAVLEVDHAEHGVLAGRLDLVGEVLRPGFPEIAGTGARAAMPDLLEEARLAEGGGRVAEVVLQDVGVVDAGVEGQGARELHVPPRRDEHDVAAADEGLHDERRSPIAPSSSSARTRRLIGSRRKFSATDRIRPFLCAASMIAIAAADGQRQRLLAHRVEAVVQQGDGDAVVRRRVRRAIGGDQPVDFACHAPDVREDRGSDTEESLRLVGQRLALPASRSQTAASRRLLCSVRASSARPPRCRLPMPPHPTIAMLSKSATPLSSSVREAVNPKSALGRGCAHGRKRQAPAHRRGPASFLPLRDFAATESVAARRSCSASNPFLFRPVKPLV